MPYYANDISVICMYVCNPPRPRCRPRGSSPCDFLRLLMLLNTPSSHPHTLFSSSLTPPPPTLCKAPLPPLSFCESETCAMVFVLVTVGFPGRFLITDEVSNSMSGDVKKNKQTNKQKKKEKKTHKTKQKKIKDFKELKKKRGNTE